MAVLLFLLLAIPLLAQQPADQEAPLFRAGVSLVRVDAQVVGRNDRTIQGLQQEDFRVFDNNQPVEIAYFGRENEPLDILLLLDVSGSMRRSLEDMANSARAALHQLHGGDRVAVMLFARRTDVMRELTADFVVVEDDLRDAVRVNNLGSSTLINPSIVAGAQWIARQEKRGRRAILIVTDNEGLNYQINDETVLRELYQADTVLNAIVVRKGNRPKPPKPGAYVNPDFTPSNVFYLSEQTGGEAFEGKGAGEYFSQMLERIRSRYALNYAAPEAEPGTLRHIRVELSPAAQQRYGGAQVRARSGYYAAR